MRNSLGQGLSEKRNGTKHKIRENTMKIIPKISTKSTKFIKFYPKNILRGILILMEGKEWLSISPHKQKPLGRYEHFYYVKDDLEMVWLLCAF